MYAWHRDTAHNRGLKIAENAIGVAMEDLIVVPIGQSADGISFLLAALGPGLRRAEKRVQPGRAHLPLFVRAFANRSSHRAANLWSRS
jgi:hypothetical protein